MACVRRGVSVMEDEGQLADHTAGIGATDGAWHHIAVSWQSSDGATALYDNGRKVRARACACRCMRALCCQDSSSRVQYSIGQEHGHSDIASCALNMRQRQMQVA